MKFIILYVLLILSVWICLWLNIVIVEGIDDKVLVVLVVRLICILSKFLKFKENKFCFLVEWVIEEMVEVIIIEKSVEYFNSFMLWDICINSLCCKSNILFILLI